MENELENMGKKMPFEVPEGYFDGFEEKMMAKLKALEAEEAQREEPKFEKVRNLNANEGRNVAWKKWSTGVAAAAVVLAGIFAVLHLQNDVSQTGEEIMVAATNSDDAYYDEINEELNSEEIEEALAQIQFGE